VDELEACVVPVVLGTAVGVVSVVPPLPTGTVTTVVVLDSIMVVLEGSGVGVVDALLDDVSTGSGTAPGVEEGGG